MSITSLIATEVKFYAVLIGLMCVLSCCHKVPDKCKFDGPHLLELPVSIEPARSIYTVGDTIYIMSVFEPILYDRKTLQHYQVEDFNFSPLTHGFDLLDSNLNTSYNLEEHFEVLVEEKYEYEIFQFSNSNTILHGQYLWENGTYTLEYILIPKRSGLFMIKHASALLATDHDQRFTGQCRNKGVEFATVVNGDTSDNNIYLLLESPDEHWNTWELEKPQERFHNQGGYAFRVVE